MPAIEVDVYEHSTPWDSAAFLATLTEDFARTIHRQRNAEGSWSVAVLNDSPEKALLQTNRYLKFRIGTTIVQAGRIGLWDCQVLGSGEEAEETFVVSGAGYLATLADAIVEQHPDQGRLQSDTRYFNFANPDYDDSLWGFAVELFRQDDAVNSLYGVDAPTDWPDPTAYWIWTVAPDFGLTPPTPVGDTYYRTVVNIAEGDYSFFIAADDGYELWVDGVLLASQTEAFQWRQTHKIDAFLAAGNHTIAIKGVNIERVAATTNGAALIFAMYSTVSGGELDTLVVHSDSTWLALGYPATPPGFTAGAIVSTLLWEAWGRDALWTWWYEFDELVDSAGNAWADEIEISFRIGEKMNEVVKKLAVTYVEVDADFDQLGLLMWNKGGRPAGSAVTLSDGVDLEDARPSQDPALVTDLYVHKADGKYESVPSGFGTGGVAQPRIEALLEAGSAPSDGSASRMADGEFDQFAAEKIKTQWTAVPSAGKVPLVDYWPGKSIQVTSQDLSEVATMIETLTVTDLGDSEDGYNDYAFTAHGEGTQ